MHVKLLQQHLSASRLLLNPWFLLGLSSTYTADMVLGLSRSCLLQAASRSEVTHDTCGRLLRLTCGEQSTGFRQQCSIYMCGLSGTRGMDTSVSAHCSSRRSNSSKGG